MRVVEVMSVSKADCDKLCQFSDGGKWPVACITFTRDSASS